MHIVYINLDRHHERRIRMDALLQGLPFQRLAAVDGMRLPATSSPLSPFEIACLESHRQAAQLLVDSDAAHVCILEDDVHLGNEFAEFIRDESWIPSGVDIIKLETMFQSVRLGQPVAARNRNLHRLYTRHHGAAGYILSRRGAQQLLTLTQNPQKPLDHIIFPDIAKQLTTLQISPALVIQDNVLARYQRNPVEILSSIQQPKAKRSIGTILLREGSRVVQHLRLALYRARRGIYKLSKAAKVNFE